MFFWVGGGQKFRDFYGNFKLRHSITRFPNLLNLMHGVTVTVRPMHYNSQNYFLKWHKVEL